MKKFISLMLVLVMICTLAACGGKETEDPAATNAPVNNGAVVSNGDAAATDAPTENAAPAGEAYTFTYGGTKIAMNAEAGPIVEALGEAKKYTEEESCAFEGLDKTYYYGSFYLQTYPEGDTDYVYCLWLVDDSVETEEGIYIGASQAEVEKAYGAENFNGKNAYVVTSGDCTLTVILENGVVNSIQYNAVVN
ncbi:MAG: hypothetical protein J6B95_01255 [Oscillospiraceae bacterium]|nr:hypothetical protein [Oscillospiraceae bacterium]